MIIINSLKEEQEKFFSILRDEEEDQYIETCVSVFDHWLTEEEAAHQIISPKALDNLNIEQSVRFLKYETSFINFYVDLYHNYDIQCVFFDYRYRPLMLNFSSEDELKNYVSLSMREVFFLKILIPKLSIAISSNFDFTHRMYTLQGNVKDMEELTLYAKKNGLYILT